MLPDRSGPQIACRNCGAESTAHARDGRRWTKCLKCHNRWIACRACGRDITGHARFNRGWTECGVCYWKRRLDHQKPLEDLLRERTELRARLKELPAEIERLQTVVKQRSADRGAKSSWWDKLVGLPRDQVLHDQQKLLLKLEFEQERMQQDLQHLDIRIESAKKVKKRYLERFDR